MTSQPTESPRPVGLDQLCDRLSRKVRPEVQILLSRKHAHHYPQMERVIIAAEGARSLVSVADDWMRISDAKDLYRRLISNWSVRWADCDCWPDGPWTVVWNLGPLPLRVWNRKGLRLESDGITVRGGFISDEIAVSDIVDVQARSRWLGLRCAVILRTRAKTFEVHGVLGDADDDFQNHWAVMLASRMCAALSL